MASKNFNVKIKQVCHTTAEWVFIVDTIEEGILCIEFVVDESGVVTNTKAKVGDGTRTYAELPYLGGEINLTNFYTKTETDDLIDEKITNIGNIFVIKGTKSTVAELPTEGNKTGDVWFVGESSSESTTGDDFSEYVWIESGKWEYIGKIATVTEDRYTKYTITQDENDPYLIHFTGTGTDPVTTDIVLPKTEVFQGATIEGETVIEGKAGLISAPTHPDALLFGDGVWYEDIIFNAQI